MGSSSRPPSVPRRPSKRAPPLGSSKQGRQQSLSPRRLALATLPRQPEQQAWSTPRHLEEALKAAESTCLLAISDVRECPPTPITAAVARQQAEQGVVTVRRVTLSRPPSASLERLPIGPGGGASSSSSSRSATPRSAPLSARPNLPPQLPHSEAMQRRLSQEEAETKTADALNYFHGARAINQRSRSVDTIEAALAGARRRRAERSASAERRHKELEGPTDANSAERSTSAERCRKDLEGDAAANSTEPCAAVPSPVQETPATKPKEPLAGDPAEETKPSGKLSFRAAATAVATTVRRKSLAEQFGYGVAPKQQEEKPAEPPPEEQPKKTLGSGFVGVQAGDTDLLQRLRARRRTADAGA